MKFYKFYQYIYQYLDNKYFFLQKDTLGCNSINVYNIIITKFIL